MQTLVLDGDTVTELLGMTECIGAMERALRALHEERAVQPLRVVVLPPPGSPGAVAAMPAYLGDPSVMGAKLISVFPGNRASGLESHQGVVVLFDSENGAIKAIVDASAITAVRTAAVSGLATRLLAKPGAVDLALLGSGTQAATHLDAMRAVRDIRSVRVWSRTSENARRFAEKHTQRCGIPIVAVESARDAVSGAEIVCTLTGSATPVLEGAWLAHGMHVNAVGASVPSSRELDAQAVAMSKVYVDRLESAQRESGDILIARAEGAIDDNHIVGELGALLAQAIPGRESTSEITLFKSLGLAIEDLAAAQLVFEKATAAGRGKRIDV
jgi:alanine dehydrogenase